MILLKASFGIPVSVEMIVIRKWSRVTPGSSKAVDAG